MSTSGLQNNFSVKLGIVQNASTLRDLLAFRASDRDMQEIVDSYVPETWARVLTASDIDKAFRLGNRYGVEQAYYALGWWQGTHEKQTPTGIREVPNNENWKGQTPAIATFPFTDYFVKNTFLDIDDFFLEEGLINATDGNGDTALVYSSYQLATGNMIYRARVIHLVNWIRSH